MISVISLTMVNKSNQPKEVTRGVDVSRKTMFYLEDTLRGSFIDAVKEMWPQLSKRNIERMELTDEQMSAIKEGLSGDDGTCTITFGIPVYRASCTFNFMENVG